MSYTTTNVKPLPGHNNQQAKRFSAFFEKVTEIKNLSTTEDILPKFELLLKEESESELKKYANHYCNVYREKRWSEQIKTADRVHETLEQIDAVYRELLTAPIHSDINEDAIRKLKSEACKEFSDQVDQKLIKHSIEVLYPILMKCHADLVPISLQCKMLKRHYCDK